MRKVTAVFSKTLTYLFLLIVAVFAVFPVIYILLGSFKSNTEILVGGVDLLPKKWLFSNYGMDACAVRLAYDEQHFLFCLCRRWFDYHLHYGWLCF